MLPTTQQHCAWCCGGGIGRESKNKKKKNKKNAQESGAVWEFYNLCRSICAYGNDGLVESTGWVGWVVE